MKHTREELSSWQKLPLDEKISMTKMRIKNISTCIHNINGKTYCHECMENTFGFDVCEKRKNSDSEGGEKE